MFSFGANAHKERFFVIFDISSASIGACIAVRTGESMKLAWHTRVPFGYQSGADFDRYVKTMYATLLEVGMRVSGEGVKHAKISFSDCSMKGASVHCIIGAPWFYGAVETIEKNAELPFQVSPEIVSSMLQEGAEVVMNAKGSFMSWEDLMGQSVLLEARPDRVTFEGYPVSVYDEREVKHLSLHTYYSIISESVKGHTEEVLQKVFPNHTIHFTTSTHLFASTPLERNERVTMIEVGEEVTTVSVIKQGMLKGTAMYPSGMNHILRNVVPKATNVQDAQKLLEVLIPKKVDGKELDFESLAETLKEALEKWQAGVSTLMVSVLEGIAPPLTIKVIVDPLWQPLFTSTLSNPSEMPGIRKSFNPRITGVTAQKKKRVTKDENLDYRLSTVAMLYEGYTREKGVCYTIE